jgi:hypothetical protein
VPDDDLVRTSCPNLTCGVPFSVPRHIREQTKSHGKDRAVFCPNGHQFHWLETNEERLAKQIAELQAQLEGLRSIKCSQEDEIDGLHRTIRYWRGIAHRKPKVKSV